MTSFELFVYFVLFIKILFLIFFFAAVYEKRRNNDVLYSYFSYWKNTVEFVFVVTVSIYLIRLFNLRKKPSSIVIDRETQIIFFTYSIIILYDIIDSTFFNKETAFSPSFNLIKKNTVLKTEKN